VRTRFSGVCDKAARGELTGWGETPLAALALVILLDQFPRNIFRGTAQAFASDALAIEVAGRILERGFDRALRPIERVFAYLPFEHAENLEAQQRSLALFGELARDVLGTNYLEYVRRHHEIIARFGRFPHRNDCMGRASTPEEIEFLKQGGSRF
jgi:uncharacterized protein (DUF924 family)